MLLFVVLFPSYLPQDIIQNEIHANNLLNVETGKFYSILIQANEVLCIKRMLAHPVFDAAEICLGGQSYWMASFERSPASHQWRSRHWKELLQERWPCLHLQSKVNLTSDNSALKCETSLSCISISWRKHEQYYHHLAFTERLTVA